MNKSLGLILVIFIIGGCENNIDVPFINDADEIERYIANDDLAKIFFSTDNLISELPYSYPYDSTGYYVDLLDSIDREVISFFPLKEYGKGYADPSQEFGSPFGSSQDAEVTVRDRVYSRTIRIEGNDTTLINVLVYRDYERYGYFMKLGNDAQKYSGWLFWGFNGGWADKNTRMSMYHADNLWFPGDPLAYQQRSSIIVENSGASPVIIKRYTTTQGYLILNGDPEVDKLIERTVPGEQLRAEVTSTNYGVFYTMLYNDGDSTLLKNFTLNNDSNFEAPIQTASVNKKTWDFIYFQEFVREPSDTTAIPRFQTLKRKNWIIPFKAE